MVEELLEQPGSAYDPVLFEFTTDVTNDQTSEIERMHAVLVSLSDDPRAGLSAGFMDAGSAISNLNTRRFAGETTRFLRPGKPGRFAT